MRSEELSWLITFLCAVEFVLCIGVLKKAEYKYELASGRVGGTHTLFVICYHYGFDGRRLLSSHVFSSSAFTQ